MPFYLSSNVTADLAINAGVASLFNRLPTGWLVTLVNNHGVVKQMNGPTKYDAQQGRLVTLQAADSVLGSQVEGVWVRDGGGARTLLAWDVLAGCSVAVESGGLRIVEFVLTVG